LVEGVIVESNQLAHASAGPWIVAASDPIAIGTIRSTGTRIQAWLLNSPLARPVGAPEVERVHQKTRPPAEYDALATLPCPDIEIGSRHPVKAVWPRFRPANVIHFTTGSVNCSCGWPAAIASASSRPRGSEEKR